ncbi:hypothetical protein NDU88_000805 [Pleurodeles waltl]|uniref:Uncharacterized protein n=1 Tax=Pleurodeles waltl TaxID=8319 RepID=A0AAV7Q800_PLEWA|nr:hypothetical protein NDU88_000805 [Pleurodeles waltl]
MQRAHFPAQPAARARTFQPANTGRGFRGVGGNREGSPEGQNNCQFSSLQPPTIAPNPIGWLLLLRGHMCARCGCKAPKALARLAVARGPEVGVRFAELDYLSLCGASSELSRWLSAVPAAQVEIELPQVQKQKVALFSTIPVMLKKRNKRARRST